MVSIVETNWQKEVVISIETKVVLHILAPPIEKHDNIPHKKRSAIQL
jgi:hypothetical protein